MRRAGLTGTTSVISQGLAIAISLVSVPLTLNYLGPERYGVWLTISSILSWLAMTDFGFAGNALVNTLAEADGREDCKMAQESVATAFWTLSALAVVVGLAVTIALRFVSLRSIFRVSEAVSSGELTAAFALAFGSFLLMFPLSIITSIYRGHQEGHIGNLWLIGANVTALIALIAVCRSRGGLPELVLAVSSARVVVGIVNAIQLFGFQRRWLSPRISAVNLRAFRRLANLAGKYMVTQLSSMGIYQSQPIMITQLLGPSYVFVFTVAQRLLTLPLNLVYILTLPLLSAYGEAKARGDWGWIWSAYRTSMLIAAAIGIGLAVALAFSARFLIRIWAGPLAVPEMQLVVWLSVYGSAASLMAPMSHLLMGVERVGAQAVLLSLTAVATITGGLLLGRHFGLPGIAMAMALSIVLVNGVGQWREIRALRRGSAEPKVFAVAESLS